MILFFSKKLLAIQVRIYARLWLSVNMFNFLLGARHAHSGTNQGDEPQLHRVQVSSNQGAPLAKSFPCPHLT